MAYVLLDMAAAETTTTGTGNITLGAVVTGYQSFANAGLTNGDTFAYGIVDGDEREIGTGTYTAAGTLFSRSVIYSTNADAAINLSGSGVIVYSNISQSDVSGGVAISGTPVANDFARFTDASTIEGRSYAEVRTSLNVADGADSTSGQHTIWIPAGALTPTTTNGAAKADLELATNDVMISTADFDTTTEEHAQTMIFMPKSWDAGTMILQPIWSHAATTTNFGVVWGFQARSYANGDALDQAFGTEVTSTDTGGTTNDIYIGPETSAMTASGTAVAEEPVIFQVSRVVANGSDNMAIDARLHGFKIHYTTDAGTDD